MDFERQNEPNIQIFSPKSSCKNHVLLLHQSYDIITGWGVYTVVYIFAYSNVNAAQTQMWELKLTNAVRSQWCSVQQRLKGNNPKKHTHKIKGWTKGAEVFPLLLKHSTLKKKKMHCVFWKEPASIFLMRKPSFAPCSVFNHNPNKITAFSDTEPVPLWFLGRWHAIQFNCLLHGISCSISWLTCN